jgi:hypothetical protein
VSADTKRSLRDVKLGENVQIFDFVNLYGCEIGDNSKVGTFVEIQKGARSNAVPPSERARRSCVASRSAKTPSWVLAAS